MSDPISPEPPPLSPVMALLAHAGGRIVMVCPGLMPIVDALEEEGFYVGFGSDGHHLFAFERRDETGELPVGVAIWPEDDGIAITYPDGGDAIGERVQGILDILVEAQRAADNLDEEHAALLRHDHDA